VEIDSMHASRRFKREPDSRVLPRNRLPGKALKRSSKTAENGKRVVVGACCARSRTIRQLTSARARTQPHCRRNLIWKSVYHSESSRQALCRRSSDRPTVQAKGTVSTHCDAPCWRRGAAAKNRRTGKSKIPLC